MWWDKNQGKFARQDNLEVLYLDQAATDALAAMADRSMDIQVTIQDGQIWFSTEAQAVTITPEVWQVP